VADSATQGSPTAADRYRAAAEAAHGAQSQKTTTATAAAARGTGVHDR